MTFDINKSIQQGERDAKAQAKAKRRGAALGRSSGSGKSKSGFSRSSGRAAIGKMKIRGRGISIESHGNGTNFKNRIGYANKEKKNPELIYSNSDIRSMLACAKLRPDIEKPVGHISMSLPPRSGKISKKEWEELTKTARDHIGLDDTFPVSIYRHNDAVHDHVHMIFSRISVSGKCHDAQNIKYKCAAVERILEDRHSLKLVPPSEFKNVNSKITKSEIEKGLRTQQKPPRLLIADALKIALQGRPTTSQFVERINAAGIGVRANVASTGKMNGFSFVFEGVEFGASKISKEYGWKSLNEVIDYEQNRDAEFLQSLDGAAGDASENSARIVAVVDGLDRAIGTVPTQTPDTRANHRNDPLAADRAGELFGKAKPIQTQSVEPATIAGFSRSGILDSSLRGWVGSLHNRFARARVLSDKAHADRLALFDARDRVAAIETAEGYAVADQKILTDEQILSLIEDLGGAQDEVEIKGNPDFCERVEQIAKANGLQIKHEFQVSAGEKKAAEVRWEKRQREEKNATLPTFAPRG